MIYLFIEKFLKAHPVLTLSSEKESLHCEEETK
jgi:hypothetical protein